MNPITLKTLLAPLLVIAVYCFNTPTARADEFPMGMRGKVGAQGIDCYARANNGLLQLRFSAGSSDDLDLRFKAAGILKDGDTLMELATQQTFKYKIEPGTSNYGVIQGSLKHPKTGSFVTLKISGLTPRLSWLDSFSYSVAHKPDFTGEVTYGTYRCNFN